MIRLHNVERSYPLGRGQMFYVLRDIDLDIAAGEFLTLLGPSGSGKTTTLMMVAGFTTPSGGDILLDGKAIGGLAPERRNIGVVFQNYALFPHMNVYENVAFPLRMRHQRRPVIEERVKAALQLVQLGNHGERMPRQLSGGQQQRVAFARSLVFDPDLLLMDEPLGALDKNLREQMQFELKRLHSGLGITILYVTHDQEEALTMSDRVALMNKGAIEQLGRADELYEHPANRFVAEFIGSLPINLLRAALVEDGASLRVGPAGLPLTLAQAARLRVHRDGPLTLGIRPEDMTLVDVGAVEGALPGRVAVLEPQGDRTVIIADTPVGRVSALVPSNRAPRPARR